MTHGPSHKERGGVSWAKRRKGLFLTSGFLSILGFSTHFPASNLMEKTETRDTKLLLHSGLTSHSFLFLSQSAFQILGFEEPCLSLSACGLIIHSKKYWELNVCVALWLQGVLVPALPYPKKPQPLDLETFDSVLFHNMAPAWLFSPEHLHISLLLVKHLCKLPSSGFLIPLALLICLFISLISLGSFLKSGTLLPFHCTSLWYIGKVEWKQHIQPWENYYHLLSTYCEPVAQYSCFTYEYL